MSTFRCSQISYFENEKGKADDHKNSPAQKWNWNVYFQFPFRALNNFILIYSVSFQFILFLFLSHSLYFIRSHLQCVSGEFFCCCLFSLPLLCWLEKHIGFSFPMIALRKWSIWIPNRLKERGK